MERIRCKCGREANVVECGMGAYINCHFCGAGTYMCTTKGEAIKMFREQYALKGDAETEVLSFARYSDLEKAADRTAVKIKEGFMEMGYILKVARDTDILAGSGYGSHEEFAEKRYGLDKGTVSRYIRIVERFSVDGDSCLLKENYKNIGFAKLSLMLHMPDAIAEEITEKYSKQEVQEIKEEVEAEKSVSDIEVAIEAAEIPPEEREKERSLLELAVRQLGREQPNLYTKLWEADKAFTNAVKSTRILETLAPQGDAIYMVRVPGMGRLMLSLSGDSASVTSVRGGDKEEYSLDQVSAAVHGICRPAWTAGKSYQDEYGEKMEGQETEDAGTVPENTSLEKVAPVQQKGKEKRKESKVTKAKPPKQQVPQRQQAPASPAMEEEAPFPGQISAEEWLADMPEVSYQEIQEKVGSVSAQQSDDRSFGILSEAEYTEAQPEERICPGDEAAPQSIIDAVAAQNAGMSEGEEPGFVQEEGCPEREAYMEVKMRLDHLQRAMTLWDWWAMSDATVEKMHQEATCLAAAVEKMMAARGMDGKEYYA